MSPVFLYPGKALTDPLFVATLLMFVSLLAALRRSPRHPALFVAIVTDVLLALFSTGITGAALRHSLHVSDTPLSHPDVIVIAAGSSQGAVLSSASEERLLLGVSCWREHPQARLVIVGLDPSGQTGTPRTENLMRAAAIRMGVPAAAISLDPISRNTREHPLGLQRLGFPPNTRVAVATSNWHMRRTLQEFRRHFATVGPCPGRTVQSETMTLDALIPNSGELSITTMLLHEWLGIAWYALRA